MLYRDSINVWTLSILSYEVIRGKTRKKTDKTNSFWNLGKLGKWLCYLFCSGCCFCLILVGKFPVPVPPHTYLYIFINLQGCSKLPELSVCNKPVSKHISQMKLDFSIPLRLGLSFRSLLASTLRNLPTILSRIRFI